MNITSEGEELVNRSYLHCEHGGNTKTTSVESHKTIKIIDTVTGRVLFCITGNVCAVYEPVYYSVKAQIPLPGFDGTGYLEDT